MEDNKTDGPMDLISELQERAKELGCLYRIEELLSDPNRPLDEIFKGVIKAIPPGWQYPKICQAEILYKDKTYTSENFSKTPWVQNADIAVQGMIEGTIGVYYTESMPTVDDGPFLKEETKLIKTIAGRISHLLLHQKLRQMFGEQEEKDLAISKLQEWRGSSFKTDMDSIPPQHGKMDDHWTWRLQMAKTLASKLDPALFGVTAFYVFGSTKNATAGPGSDIDILIHFHGTDDQQHHLNLWLEGWSLCLAENNYLRTGYRSDGLLDVHIITDKGIENKSSFAVKIGAVTDPARKLPLFESNTKG